MTTKLNCQGTYCLPLKSESIQFFNAGYQLLLTGTCDGTPFHLWLETCLKLAACSFRLHPSMDGTIPQRLFGIFWKSQDTTCCRYNNSSSFIFNSITQYFNFSVYPCIESFCTQSSPKILGAEMGLDTSKNISLWKDKVSVEMNYAILHSFQKAGVSIVDQFSASEQFQEHFNNEVRERGGCPADWVWLTPSLSGSLTTLWHQEMLHYHLTPSYERQELMWQNYRYVNIAPHFQDRDISQGTPRWKLWQVSENFPEFQPLDTRGPGPSSFENIPRFGPKIGPQKYPMGIPRDQNMVFKKI